MIQGKTDPRRPDRVQRYKAPQSNGNTPVEDLTPDYMNILGPESTSTGGAAAATSASSNEPVPPADDQPPSQMSMECDANAVNNIIPTSPQYGVAIIANNATGAQDSAASIGAHDTAVDNDPCNKDAVTHTTPSRTNHVNSNNDRFKVVKIATLEPFRRGRWKCMDYVDENPPISATANMSKACNNNAAQQQQQYMQTQSLPQQHFQQMQQQFYQNLSATGAQVQFFYPAQSSAQQQANTTTFISAAGGGGATGGATYYQQVIPNSSGGMTLVNYPSVQYVPANLIQTQAGSAFVPTSQNINTAQIPSNLQQSQTYGGPTSNLPTGGGQQGQQQPPLVNGHTFPPSNQSVGEQQQATNAVAQQTAPVTTSTLPTHAHVAKNVILGGQPQVPMQPATAGQYSVNQQQTAPASTIFQTNTSTQATPLASAIVTPSSMQAPVSNQSGNFATNVTRSNNNLALASVDVSSAAAAAAAVYSNPQFVASVNKIVESAVSMIDAATASANNSPIQQAGQHHHHNMEVQGDMNSSEQAGQSSSASVSGEDTTTKANPVVNAIDNKIEQAMDLVKSHLMFTVREEVEVLKEKIAELMERIQQLESENNMLRTQALPKQHVNLIQTQQTQQQAQQTASNSNLSTDTSPSSSQLQHQQQQPQ